MRLAGVGPGDEVITSPFSFVASANCAIYEGATPVFADIDPRTYNLDPAAVEAAITERTKAIVAVDIFGYPCELDPLIELCERHGLALVEDACEALGARYKGRAARLARPSDDVRVLSEQADHDGRGRSGHDERRGRARAARLAAQPGTARDELVAPARPARLQLPPRRRVRRARHRAAREARPRSSRRDAERGRARYTELLAGSRRRAAAGGRRGPRPFVVRVRREAAGPASTATPSLGRMRERGVATRAVRPVDPPPAVHARALRLPRGDAARLARTASARTLALPFHARLGRDDQEYVVETLRSVLG